MKSPDTCCQDFYLRKQVSAMLASYVRLAKDVAIGFYRRIDQMG
jgi:hypothetical protein